MEQLSIFDSAGAEAATRDAIERVDRHTPQDWRPAARAALRWCRLNHRTFTADQVWRRLEVMGIAMPPTPAALGPVFLAAQRAGEIAPTGEMRQSQIPRRHRRLTVWAGC